MSYKRKLLQMHILRENHQMVFEGPQSFTWQDKLLGLIVGMLISIMFLFAIGG